MPGGRSNKEGKETKSAKKSGKHQPAKAVATNATPIGDTQSEDSSYNVVSEQRDLLNKVLNAVVKYLKDVPDASELEEAVEEGSVDKILNVFQNPLKVSSAQSTEEDETIRMKLKEVEGQFQKQSDRLKELGNEKTKLSEELQKEKDNVTKLSKELQSEKDTEKNTQPKQTEQRDERMVKLENEVTELNSKLAEKDSEITKQKSVNSSALAEKDNVIEKLQKDMKELQLQQANNKEENQQSAQSKQTTKQIDEKVVKLENEVTELKSKLAEKDSETTKQKSTQPKQTEQRDERVVKLENEVMELKSKLAEKDSEITKQKSSLSKQTEQKDEKVSKLESDMTELKSKLDAKDSQHSALSKQIEEKNNQVSQLEKKSTELKSKLDSSEAAIKSLKSKSKDNGIGDDDSELRKLAEENEHLRTRLSQIAGSKLTDNNPSIADLSDPNRPISLGEKFSELYDNQWTDAMEVLCDIISETEAISILLDIVCNAYKFCEKRSKSFMDDNMKTLELLTKPPEKEAQKACKDYRKSVAIHAVKLLQEDFCRENGKYKDKKNVVEYKKTCIQVCWFMTVQDPMVVIDSNTPKKLDQDFHKPYTKSGKDIDYLVWPVLYLHKKDNGEFGPMLGKGVAQGKN